MLTRELLEKEGIPGFTASQKEKDYERMNHNSAGSVWQENKSFSHAHQSFYDNKQRRKAWQTMST